MTYPKLATMRPLASATKRRPSRAAKWLATAASSGNSSGRKRTPSYSANTEATRSRRAAPSASCASLMLMISAGGMGSVVFALLIEVELAKGNPASGRGSDLHRILARRCHLGADAGLRPFAHRRDETPLGLRQSCKP